MAKISSMYLDHTRGILSWVRRNSRSSYTTDFINKLRRLPLLPSGCLLLTLDVSSLYTNILQEEGITACEEFLNCWERQEPPTADLWELIQLVLTKNSFVFNKFNYLQIHGTAMGTRMAPSYANLFMGKFEWKSIEHVPFWEKIVCNNIWTKRRLLEYHWWSHTTQFYQP